MLNFNGIDIPNFIKVKKVDIQVLPDISFDTFELSRGCITSKTRLGKKLIKASIVIIPNKEYDSLEKCSRSLAEWLMGDNFELSKLILETDPTIYYMAKLSTTVSISDLLVAGSGELDFIVPSGLGVSATPTEYAGGTGSIPIEYIGTAPATISIDCTFSSSINNETLIFSNDLTGKRYSVTGTFNQGDHLSINTATDVVKLNDSLILSMINIDSEEIEIVKGKQNITCNNSNVYMEVTAPVNYL